ncbi:tyrosine-type recombinase/integrase, partial [Fusobacterium mortiferum]|uniref:tyrosine-type recombinase/integrase n=2 Tax=Fusobacterium TaxID=848 RepID=UPI001958D3CD|nr:tyrosine-type recombinase/integrase [Fusobacterium mortiferum]
MANKVTRTLSEDEIVKIFRYLTIDVKQMLFLQLNTGLRISDIILLKAKDIMFGKLEIKERKTGKPQLTRINMDVVEYLFKNRVYDGEYMFWDEKC